MTTSVIAFTTSFAINVSLRLMHRPGYWNLSHALATGVHWKMEAKMRDMALMIVITPRMYTAMRVGLWMWKIRWYIARMEVLVRIIEVQ